MSLYPAFFRIDKTDDGGKVTHNCDGGLGFAAEDVVTESQLRLLELAIEEGKRMKAREIKTALGITK